VGDAQPGAGLHLYSAGRADLLVERLAGVLAADPLDPMEAEWLAVPSDGMRRWVSLDLARHLGASGPGAADGVAANFRRAYPGTLRAVVLDAAARQDGGASGRAPGEDPWRIDRMVWPLLAVFDDLVAAGTLPIFTELPAGASRFTRVRAVADLFDRYHLHRPEMVRAWADPGGRHGGLVDGSGDPLAAHATWQPFLWRRLRDEIGSPSPPERMAEVVGRVAHGALDLDDELPSRLLLFGFTALPGQDFLPLVEAVARQRAVHLFLLAPHQFDPTALLAAWPAPADGHPRLRSEDLTAESVRHPLLRSWGRLSREAALLIADRAGPDGIDVLTGGGAEPTTLLGRLQAAIRADAQDAPSPVDAHDRSVQFHACFGAKRQVQVVRDAILHLLQDRAGELTEDDVLVVCPDLERLAPLVEAEFGPGGSTGGATGTGDGPPALRYRIADRSLRSTNPVLGATTALLDLVAGRFEFAEVLDFLSLAPVRARFGLDDDDLAVLAEWATETRVRWGLDPVHRSGFGVPAAVGHNTWQAALDRLLLGSAVSDGGLELTVGGVAPYGVDSGDLEVLGVFAHVLERLATLADHSERGGRTVGGWISLLRAACHDLLAAPTTAGWQFDALERVLVEVVDDAAASRRGPGVPLDLLDVRRLLERRLDSGPGRPDYFRGGVTVTSMASLRWVPFRVVCVLGLDQDSPGATAPDASDLVADSPQVGDPDPRSEARQWLLEAVLAAGDHLVVVRDGRDVRSNHEVPPAVPVAELHDAVVALVGERRTIEVVHPRHPFDEECLLPGRLVPGRPWSFSERDRRAAERRRHRPTRREPFLDERLDPVDQPVVELDALHAFLRDPVATFLRQSLEATLPRAAEQVDAVLPVEPNGLEKHQIGQNLLDARLQGASVDRWRLVERAKGALPPGVLEDRLFDDVSGEVEGLVAAAVERGVRPGDPEVTEIDVVLGDGTRIVGTVPLSLEGPGPGPGRVRFTRPKEVDRLAAWLDLMVLVATDPDTPWRSVVVTRPKSGSKTVTVIELRPVAGDDSGSTACAALARVVGLYRSGLREPLPLFPSYSSVVLQGKGADGEWRNHDGRGDGTAPAVRLVFGDVEPDEIDALSPEPHDPAGPGNRVERYARHLWGEVGRTAETVP